MTRFVSVFISRMYFVILTLLLLSIFGIVKLNINIIRETITKTVHTFRELVHDGRREWTRPDAPEYIDDLEQDDSTLADYIRNNWLLGPHNGPLNLTSPDRKHNSQHFQAEFVDNHLNERRGGFFVEAGAADGESLSNTLFLERSRNWTGLLVEPNPTFFKRLLQKHRHAYLINSCLSPSRKPERLEFVMADFMGGLAGPMEKSHRKHIRMDGPPNSTTVQCFPLAAILKAAGVNHIDYFSLDVEGPELDILKNLPFDDISVDVFSIEYLVINNNPKSKRKLREIRDFFNDKGYKEIGDTGFDIILRKV